jgi:hypothetical protein
VYDAILSSERTNKVPTMHLIMEAARIMDEGFADNGAKNALDAMSDDSGEVLPPSAAQLRSSAANHRPDSGGGVATGSDSNRFSIPSIDLESRDES